MANEEGNIAPEAATQIVARLNKADKKSKHQTILIMLLVVGIAAMGIALGLSINGSVHQGNVEVKQTITESVPTKVERDSLGDFHLVDRKSGHVLSSRATGDNAKVLTVHDSTSGRQLTCLRSQDAAMLHNDAINGAMATLSFLDVEGIESQVLPLDGHYADNGRTIVFGKEGDGITLIMDSGVCNEALGVTPNDPEDLQDTSVEDGDEGTNATMEVEGDEADTILSGEEETDYELDIKSALQAALDERADDTTTETGSGIFKRSLSHLSSFFQGGSDRNYVKPPTADPSSRVQVLEKEKMTPQLRAKPALEEATKSEEILLPGHSSLAVPRGTKPSTLDILARNRNAFEMAKTSYMDGRHLALDQYFLVATSEYSNGSAGDMILDGTTVLGTVYDAVTTFDNIDTFEVPVGVDVDVIGTIIIRANRIIIHGTLNGNGGGYSGRWVAKSGLSPAGTNGYGGGGKSTNGGNTGGGGAGHGKFMFSCRSCYHDSDSKYIVSLICVIIFMI